MSLVGDVIAYLATHRIRCALIGGEALAVHGIARATLDSDILVAHSGVLRDTFWSPAFPPAHVEIRRADVDDPLGGIVRIRRRTEQTDVIVGRPWVRPMLNRPILVREGAAELPVVDRADLILLKLFAAGPQDLVDIRLLLAAGDQQLRSQIEERLTSVPAVIAREWRRLARPPR